MERTQRLLVWGSWLLSIVVIVLAVVAWGQLYRWHVSFSPIVLFPVLGLSAYSLMWVHYIAGAIRRVLGVEKSVLKHFYTYTSYVVLALLVLHPLLLIVRLWQKGFGPPPESYLKYVGSSLQLYAVFGTVALIAFLAYELHRFYESAHWWRWVTFAGDAAMLLIFIHGLKLGSNTQMGWYRYVWIFYGVTLVVAIIYTRFIAYKGPAPKAA